MRRGIGRLRAGGGGFSPISVFAGGAAGIWLDPSDISTGFQDSAGTTPQTASGQPTGKRLDKSGRGNHVTQSTAGFRPEYDVISSIASDFYDGSDDSDATASFVAGTLTSNMDGFVAIKRAGVQGIVSVGDTQSKFFGCYNSGAAGSTASLNAGFTIFVNGNSVADDRIALATALPLGTWCVMEYRNMDMSTWTLAGVSNYGVAPWFANIDIGGYILCQAQSTANRNSLRKWLGAKVGLSL